MKSVHVKSIYESEEGCMKIKITDFGPIKEFEFDYSKKLIVTYGDNNIGKSYAMQVAYLLLKTFMNVSISQDELKNVLHDIFKSIANMNYQGDTPIVAEEQENYRSTEKMYDEISKLIIPQFIDSCRLTFGKFDLILEQEPHIYFDVKQHHMDIDLNNKKITGTTDFNYNVKRDETVVYGMAGMLYKANPLFNDIVLAIQDEVGQVHYLPASRSGIYNSLSSFGSIVAELSKNKDVLTMGMKFPNLSVPISDYFVTVSNIAKYGEYIADAADNRVKKCCDDVEKAILKGKVIIDKNTNVLMYAPDDMNTQLSLSEVSSMVSEVSLMLAFFKYVLINKDSKYINNKGILFIEEPEAHLHPNNQLKLMEVFAELAQAGITIVMSSHSNYVFNKLNNLVLSGKLDYNIYEPILLEKGEDGSVSKLMHIDECGADDENFLDVSEALYNEREQIIQELNEGTE